MTNPTLPLNPQPATVPVPDAGPTPDCTLVSLRPLVVLPQSEEEKR